MTNVWLNLCGKLLNPTSTKLPIGFYTYEHSLLVGSLQLPAGTYSRFNLKFASASKVANANLKFEVTGDWSVHM
jgi:hypothetical protein